MAPVLQNPRTGTDERGERVKRKIYRTAFNVLMDWILPMVAFVAGYRPRRSTGRGPRMAPF